MHNAELCGPHDQGGMYSPDCDRGCGQVYATKGGTPLVVAKTTTRVSGVIYLKDNYQAGV